MTLSQNGHGDLSIVCQSRTKPSPLQKKNPISACQRRRATCTMPLAMWLAFAQSTMIYRLMLKLWPWHLLQRLKLRLKLLKSWPSMAISNTSTRGKELLDHLVALYNCLPFHTKYESSLIHSASHWGGGLTLDQSWACHSIQQSVHHHLDSESARIKSLTYLLSIDLLNIN